MTVRATGVGATLPLEPYDIMAVGLQELPEY